MPMDIEKLQYLLDEACSSGEEYGCQLAIGFFARGDRFVEQVLQFFHINIYLHKTLLTSPGGKVRLSTLFR